MPEPFDLLLKFHIKTLFITGHFFCFQKKKKEKIKRKLIFPAKKAYNFVIQRIRKSIA